MTIRIMKAHRHPWLPCLLGLLLFYPVLSRAQAEPATTNTVAVLDFVQEDPQGGANNWAIGLADFFAMELQQRGVVILERRDLRYILSERQLSLTGAMAKDALVRQSLPAVKYLVQGNVKATGKSRFSLAVGVVDPRSGLELQSFEASGAYPSDWLAAIGRLAGQIAATLGATGSRSEKVPFGFTRQPEVAWYFYQGVSHCLEGRPEFGVALFRQARRLDLNFLQARVWEMRAYEMLGFEDHAKLAEADLLAMPQGKKMALEIALHRSHASNEIVVAVTGKGPQTEKSRAAVDHLKKALLASSNIKVFSPQYLQEISREKNLQLSGEFESQGEYDDRNWLAVDAIAAVEHLSPSDRFRVQIRDGLSGKVNFTTETSVGDSLGDALLASVRTALLREGPSNTTAEVRLAPNEEFWRRAFPSLTFHGQQFA